MRDDPKLLEQLRDLFQDRVDALERSGSEHLDRWVELGARDLTRLREELEERRPRSRSGRSKRRPKRGRRYRRRSKEVDSVEAERREIRRRARRRANYRIAFLTHFGIFVATLAIILVASRSIRVAMIVALSWGIGVFIHYLWAVVAPTLRDRWVEDQVGVRSPRAVASERRQVETRSRRSIEGLSASIAHEIRNPITAAKSLVQQMGEDPASPENVEYAEIALSELDRVERSISHLLRYARDEEPRFEGLEMRTLVEATVDGLRERARTSGVELCFDFDGQGAMRGDPEKLRRVVENLVSNALDAVAEAPEVGPRIDVLGGENLAGNEIWVRVIDNGPGIIGDDRERIWSPFFSTKESGTGLGLALSRKTVEAHGGRIELLADSKRGSEFVVSFPKDPRDSEARAHGVGDDG